MIYNFGKLSKLREYSRDIVEKLKILIIHTPCIFASKSFQFINFVSFLLHRDEINKRAECVCGCLERLYLGFLP